LAATQARARYVNLLIDELGSSPTRGDCVMRWTLDDFSDAEVLKALIEAMREDGGAVFRSNLMG
jgi:hypothetical protein